MKETEIAWAAGFYDGEGSISLNLGKQRENPIIRITVTQHDKRPLERLAKVIGGKVLGPYKDGEGWQYQISLSSLDCFGAMELLLPYLSEPKREQAWDVYVRYQMSEDGRRKPRRKSYCTCGNEKSSKSTECYDCRKEERWNELS